LPRFRIFLSETDATARPVDSTGPVSDPPIVPATGGSQVTLRVVAALVMIPPVLACIYFGYPVFSIFVAVIVALMAWEWRRIIDGGAFGAKGVVFALALVAVMVAGSLSQYLIAYSLLAAFAVFYLAKSVFSDGAGTRSLWMSFGTLYIGLPTLALIWLRGDDIDGRNTIYWLFVLVWAADTGAYVAGRLIGGAKLAPAVSPNKTWAGLAGCVVSAALVGVGVAYLSKSGDYVVLAGLSALIGLVSQGGDLVESAIKRHFDIKDSSQLIPGHGGIFDRVDALLAAILVAALIKFSYGDSIIQWS